MSTDDTTENGEEVETPVEEKVVETEPVKVKPVEKVGRRTVVTDTGLPSTGEG